MFRIDQTGLPTGVDDVSRTDGLLTGAAVTITYAGTGTFRARLLWVPPGDTGSLTTLAELTPGSWGFTPTANKPGTYRVQGIENEGKPNERRSERTFGVRTVRGILIPAFGESCNQLAHLENATATHIAQSSNNAADFPETDLNDLRWAGWWRVWHEMATLLDATVGPVLPWSDDYGPTSIAANVALPYYTAFVLPAPATSATVIDYVVRVHAQQTSNPPLESWDDTAVIRVSRDATNTWAVIVGGPRQFADPHLRVTVTGTTALVSVRADPYDDWTYTAAVEVSLVPFDARRINVHELAIGTGAAWVNVLGVPVGSFHPGEQIEVDYSVRGRFNASGSFWSFVRAKGTFALENSNGTITLVDEVNNWTDARIRVYWAGGGPWVFLQMEQHATENWLADAEYTATRIGL